MLPKQLFFNSEAFYSKKSVVGSYQSLSFATVLDFKSPYSRIFIECVLSKLGRHGNANEWTVTIAKVNNSRD